MVLAIEVLRLFTLIVVFLLLPYVLAAGLLIMSRRYRGMFDHIGFSRKEIGLLVGGSLAASFLRIDVPFLVYGDYLLAVNASGAIIPVVLSVHLLRAKKIHFASWSLGILGVALVTFLITRVQPAAGIVAEFPWLFLPSLSAAAIALALYSRGSPKAPAYAYATATFGSLIGADFFHLPELFALPAFVGSLGGAGVSDLVYLAGIMSLTMVLLFAFAKLRRLKATLPHFEVAQQNVTSELAASTGALMAAKYHASVQRTLVAVQQRLRHLLRGNPEPINHLALQVFRDPVAKNAYALLVQYADRSDADEETARWAMFQGQFLLDRLDAIQKRSYASIPLRVAAFSLDALFMVILVLAFGAVLLTTAHEIISAELIAATVVLFAISTQMIYFTMFEFLFAGRTPGKWIVGLQVVDLNGVAPDFITAFSRNVVRVVDFALLFYLGALVIMNASKRLQRLGDLVAETVVLNLKAPPLLQQVGGPARVGAKP